jgi:hypothetical protein
VKRAALILIAGLTALTAWGQVTITTNSLPLGTVGLGYTATLEASAGSPPYTWSVAGGSLPSGVTLAANGVLSGTPGAPGTFNFTAQVTDQAQRSASKALDLTITAPLLVITSSSPLPSGTVQLPYSYRFSATGGTVPYEWSISSGSTGDLTLDSSTGVLSGVASAPGTFSFVLRLGDSAGQFSTKLFSLTIASKPLSITTPTQLPDAMVATPVSYQFEATGGAPPYSWSANNLPDGLTLNASTGQVTGVPRAAGAFLFNVRVTDAARATTVDLFRLNVRAPALPDIGIQGLPTTANAAQQYPLRLTLSDGYPLALGGEVVLTFTPESGNGDNSVQFASGGRRVAFTIEAGETQASIPNFAIQTGTVAGTIQLTVYLRVGETDITPNPAPNFATRIERAAPEIRSARIVRGASSISVQVTGFSTSREVTQAVFRFKASTGNELRTSEFTVAVEDLFSRHFQDASSAQYGSQFVFTQPFTVQGDVNGVVPDSVTLTNRTGSTTATVTQ